MSQDKLIGKQLANYILQRRLGQGGMATVYYALDTSLDRPVAVKLIDARFQGDPEFARRFVDEARMIARWRHENIVQVYYAGQQEDIYFFAMEYIEGMTLDELISDYTKTGELMPQEDIMRISAKIAQALDYAHRQGVIHRDVKPSNVMIGFDDRIVLTDFGLALDVQRGTMGQILGTPHYISPEQARSSAEVVPQSDIYALAVMLYEMLTGQVPFDDPSAATLALKHLSVPPPPPRTINPALNADTEDVLLKALEKDIENRYQTGAELIAALKLALETSPEAALDDDLPLPPAAIGKSTPRTSRLSVSEKVALHLENKPKPEPIPRADAPSSKVQVAPIPSTSQTQTMISPKKDNSKLFMLGGGALIALLLIIIAVMAFSGNSQSPSATATPQSIVIEVTVTSAPTDVLPTALVEQATATFPVIDVVASQTPQEVILPTNTLAPSNRPTITPFPTFTPQIFPTFTPQIFPTFTPQIITQAPTNPPQPTVLYPNGRRTEVFWDDYSFYFLNQTGATLRISPIRFEALDANGNSLPYAFEGEQWSRFFRSVENNKCDAIEIGRAPALLKPAQCRAYNAIINPTPTDPMIFWRVNDGVAQFRVLWNGQELARCAATAGQCVIMLPPE